MKINLEVFYLSESGTHINQRGPFEVNKEEFEEDPDFTAAVRAYEWTQQIYRENGCRNMEITKVIYNGNKDITEIVKQIRPVFEDDLPF